jgi:thioredoxin-like negative regulator of GroEL
MSDVNVFMFSSPTCAPCKAIKPMIAELEEDYSQYTWVRVDITADPNGYTRQFGVANVPCMVVTKGGAVLGSWKGTQLLGYLNLLKKAKTS